MTNIKLYLVTVANLTKGSSDNEAHKKDFPRNFINPEISNPPSFFLTDIPVMTKVIMTDNEVVNAIPITPRIGVK